MKPAEIELLSRNSSIVEVRLVEAGAFVEIILAFQDGSIHVHECRGEVLEDFTKRADLLAKVIDARANLAVCKLGANLAESIFPDPAIRNSLITKKGSVVLVVHCDSAVSRDIPWETLSWSRHEGSLAVMSPQFHVVRVIATDHRQKLPSQGPPEVFSLESSRFLPYSEYEEAGIKSRSRTNNRLSPSLLHILGHQEERSVSASLEAVESVLSANTALCTLATCFSVGSLSALGEQLVDRFGITVVGVRGLWPDFTSSRVFGEFYRVLDQRQSVDTAVHFARKMCEQSLLNAWRLQLIMTEASFNFARERRLWPTLEEVLAENSDLIGRNSQIKEVYRELTQQASPIVVVSGFGGVGKTSIARVFQRAVRKRNNEECIFVAVDERHADKDLVEHIKIELSSTAGERRIAVESFSGLLILDSFEHLFSGTGALREIRQALPHAKILVTSRIFPPLEGCTEIRLGTLPVSRRAHQLSLADSLFRREIGDELTRTDDRSWASEIVELLEGHPLAIILAARCAQKDGIENVVKNLRRSLLETLTYSAYEETRHASFARVVWASLSLLDERLLRGLHTLCIFASPFSRDRAYPVAGTSYVDVSSLIDDLTSCSLLEPSVQAPGSYKVLDPVREAMCEQFGLWSEGVISQFVEYAVDEATRVSRLAWANREDRYRLLANDFSRATEFAVERNHSCIGHLFTLTARAQFEHGDSFASERLCRWAVANPRSTAQSTMEALGLLGAILSRRGESPLAEWTARADLAVKCEQWDLAIDSLCDLALDKNISDDERNEVIDKLDHLSKSAQGLDPYLMATVWATKAENARLSGNIDESVRFASLAEQQWKDQTLSSYSPYAIQLVTHVWLELGRMDGALRTARFLLEASVEGSRVVHVSWLAAKFALNNIELAPTIKIGLLAASIAANRDHATRYETQLLQRWQALKHSDARTAAAWQRMARVEDWRALSARILHDWEPASMP